MKTQPFNTYEAAKAARTAFITEWLGEHVMTPSKCYGWDKAALLLVISHSLVSAYEHAQEKSDINTYTNEQCRLRVAYWQALIAQRAAFNQLA